MNNEFDEELYIEELELEDANYNNKDLRKEFLQNQIKTKTEQIRQQRNNIDHNQNATGRLKQRNANTLGKKVESKNSTSSNNEENNSSNDEKNEQTKKSINPVDKLKQAGKDTAKKAGDATKEAGKAVAKGIANGIKALALNPVTAPFFWGGVLLLLIVILIPVLWAAYGGGGKADSATENDEYISYVEGYDGCKSITVKGLGTYSLEDYIAGVIQHEAYQDIGNEEALKAQAVAARSYVIVETNRCTKSIGNSQYSQTFSTNPSEKAKKAAQDTLGEVLTYNGNVIKAMYDSFCYADRDCPDAYRNPDGTYSVSYSKVPGGEIHKITLNDPVQYKRIVPGGGHAHGMSQLVSYQMSKNGSSYKDILKYFYSSSVEIQTISKMSVRRSNKSGACTARPPLDIGKDEEYYVSSGFGPRWGSFHRGVDLPKNIGTPIYAVFDGVVVVSTEEYYTAGRAVIIAHDLDGDGGVDYRTLYYHMSRRMVNEGDVVVGGQQIGEVGNSGVSTGPHLHFGIQYGDLSYFDPMKTLNDLKNGNSIFHNAKVCKK